MNDFLSRRRALQFHANYHGNRAKRSLDNQGQVPTTFQTPGSVSADEEQQSSTNTAAPLLANPSPPSNPIPKPKKSLKQRIKDLTVKQWIIIGVVAFVVLWGIALAVWALWPEKEPAPTPVVQQAQPEPVVIRSNLTGLEVDEEVNKRPVTAIMIENSTVSRPQSGLLQAGVVFEAIAEGGITRFLALYQDSEPKYIGPVRSIRKPYLQWMLGFDGALAHVGGSAEALKLIKQWDAKDLDQFANPGAYWRVGNRAAPHNMYTSIDRLRDVEKRKGYGAAKYTSLERKEKETPASKPKASTISLNISGANYNVRYQYDKSTNTYKRFLAGAKHTDERSGDQLAPKVVVVPVMTQGKNGIYTTYDTIGQGKVYVFQDGKVHQGTWTKRSNEAQFKFADKNGDAIKLNPGQTWFTIVGSSSRVTASP